MDVLVERGWVECVESDPGRVHLIVTFLTGYS